ncbi:MAG TPA: hypothetical protein VGB83_04070 [Actinomycetota bacterium]
MSQTESVKEPTSTGPARRERSSISFPYGDLDDAVAVAKGVFDVGGGSCESDQLAAQLGHDSVKSGTFRLRLTTARIFGALEPGQGTLRLTDLGRQLADPAQERSARVRAFLAVPLYRKIYDEYKGQRLPGDDGLETRMVAFGVAQKQRDKARQAFQRSADQAGMFAAGRDRLVVPGGVNLTDNGEQGAEPPGEEPPPRQETHHHALIQGLFKMLPQDGPFSTKKQAQWLEAARLNLALVYGSDDSEENEIP